LIVKLINVRERPTFNGIINLLLSEHVVEKIDYRARSIEGIRGIIAAFVTGEFVGYGAWEDDRMVGFVWGHLNNGCWEAHTAFDRHSDTLSAGKLIELTAPKELGIKKVLAYSPISNKPARVFHHRLGYKRNGIKENYYMKDYNKFEDCVIMQKEY